MTVSRTGVASRFRLHGAASECGREVEVVCVCFVRGVVMLFSMLVSYLWESNSAIRGKAFFPSPSSLFSCFF